MITRDTLDSLDPGTPIELIRPGDSTLRFVKEADGKWRRTSDDERFVSAAFEFHHLQNVRLLPLESLAALAEENK